jgi:hypothetical protein
MTNETYNSKKRGAPAHLPPDMKNKNFGDLYNRGFNDEAISLMCAVSANTVTRWRRSLGLPVVHDINVRDIRMSIKKHTIEKSETEDPYNDPESLFCSDTTFLETICGKPL